MNNLAIVKSENFGQVQCDFWKDEQGNIYMTAKQLGEALGYSNPVTGINNVVDRNEYLKQNEFSTYLKLRVLEGNREVSREMRVFTEDGIYEVTFLSGTEKAKEFRAWVRKILKALRKGQAKIIPTEDKKKLSEARYNNSLVRKANILLKLAEKEEISPTYRQILYTYATEIVAGKPLLPLPELQEETLTAEQVGKILGISANKVGRIAKEHNLKTEEYGKWFHDKSRYSNKEVPCFRYYKSVIPVIQEILGKDIESEVAEEIACLN
jgi:prophage antirepressor-like protein